MEVNTGRRCAPLCQHPGCWESERARSTWRRRHTKFNSYVEKLLHHSSAKTRGAVSGGLPLLTVQSLAVDGISARDHTERTTAATSTTSPGACLSSSPHPPKLNNVEVLLEPVKFSPSTSSSLTFSPVLIWKPGRCPQSSGRLQGQGGNVSMKTHNMTDDLPPERPASDNREKGRFHNTRPHSRLHNDSLDFLQDMPHYVVTEILQQLQSESTATLPPHYSHPSSSTHTTSHERANYPSSSYIPSSLVCDLSTGQLYCTTGTNTRPPPHAPPPALPPSSPPQSRDRKAVPCVVRKRANTLPSMPKKTSFSRALSHSPMSVLHGHTESFQHSKHHTAKTIHTINHCLLPLAPHPIPPPPTRHHNVRYPLGNPTVPRSPRKPSINPLLAPYHKTQDRVDPHQNTFLHMCPTNIHNTRLVTLHAMDNRVEESTAAAGDVHSTVGEETTEPLTGPKGNTVIVHLPPPSPPPPLSCVSPDHMQMGAAILGDQLVLDREGEQVVHPLRDTSSQTSVGRASRPETTPSEVGVASGTQAPPPTASEHL